MQRAAEDHATRPTPRQGPLAAWRLIRASVLAMALAAAPLAATAQTAPADTPLYGCHTEDGLEAAMAALADDDRGAFDALLADNECVALDGLEFSILETQLMRLRARIKLNDDYGASVLWTDLNVVAPM